jgi:hypothetical protein
MQGGNLSLFPARGVFVLLRDPRLMRDQNSDATGQSAACTISIKIHAAYSNNNNCPGARGCPAAVVFVCLALAPPFVGVGGRKRAKSSFAASAPFLSPALLLF